MTTRLPPSATERLLDVRGVAAMKRMLEGTTVVILATGLLASCSSWSPADLQYSFGVDGGGRDATSNPDARGHDASVADRASPPCAPGHQVPCACTNGEPGGIQVCAADGGGYGACTGCSISDASFARDVRRFGDAHVPGDAASGGDAGPSSCAPGGPGLTTCPGGTGTESCCTSLAVPGGTYYRTYDEPGVDGGVTLAADGGPAEEFDPATVSSFQLDKYPVTVARFRQFALAWQAGYMPPAGSGKHTHLNAGQGLENSGAPGTYETGWLASDDIHVAPTDYNLTLCPMGSTWTSSPGSQESLPINCVDWYFSYAFCIWDGGFLPSEAEWEYAAAGGAEQREYPWGSASPGTDSQYAICDCDYPTGSSSCTGTVANFAPVGTALLGAARWGHLDMLGEVSAWNLDWSTVTHPPSAS